MHKFTAISFQALPILVMIGLIPLVANDYLLTLLYTLIIASLLFFKRERNDVLVLVLGFFVMMFFEFVFVSTGEETFTRTTLLGVMPLWLPFLWAYGFVAIKRAVLILDEK